MQRVEVIPENELSTDTVIDGLTAGATDDGPDDIFDEHAVAESVASLWSIFKSLCATALPIAASQTQSVQFFVTGLLLVRDSDNKEMLGSVGLIFKTLGFLYVSLSPILGAAVTISNQRGELEREIAEHPEVNHDEIYDRISAIPKSLLITSAITAPIAFSSMFFSRNLLISIFRQEEDVARYAEQFLRVYSAAVPGFAIRGSLAQICYGFSKNVPSMVISLASLGVSSVVGAGLSFGWFGNEPLRRVGLAIGGVIEPYIAAALYAGYIHYNSDFANFHFLAARNNKYIITQIKSVLKIGLPISFTVTTDIVGGMAYGALIGMTGGKNALAASSIIDQYGPFSSLLRTSLSQAVAIETGRLSGSKQNHAASRYARAGFAFSMMAIAPAPVIFSAAPDVLLLMSGKTVESMTYLRQLAPIFGSIQITEAMRLIFTKECHALKDHNVPALISMLGMSSGLVSGAFLGIYTPGGVFALTGSYAAGQWLAAGGMAMRWVHSTKPEVIEARQALHDASKAKPSTFSMFKCCDNKKSATNDLVVVEEEEKLLEGKTEDQGLPLSLPAPKKL